mgnify:CR=1 FL=1
MDLICTASVFLKATIFVAIGTDYARIDSMENFKPTEGEHYVYCEPIGGGNTDFNIENGILILTPDIKKL